MHRGAGAYICGEETVRFYGVFSFNSPVVILITLDLTEIKIVLRYSS